MSIRGSPGWCWRPRLAGFLAAYPALSLEIVVRDTLGEMIAEGFDAAVRFGEPEPSGLVARKLLETRILTLAAPDYLARHGTPLHPLDLERHECLMFRDPVTGRPFPWEFHRGGEVAGCGRAGRLVLNDLATKLAACAAGNGIAQTIELGVGPLLASGELVQICRTGRMSGFRSMRIILAAPAAREGARVPRFRGGERRGMTIPANPRGYLVMRRTRRECPRDFGQLA